MRGRRLYRQTLQQGNRLADFEQQRPGNKPRPAGTDKRTKPWELLLMESGPEALCREFYETNRPVIYLKQGEYYLSEDGPALVRTILGSCVTVTMHCPVAKIGGITHSLLPYPLHGTRVPPGHKGRFVDSSIYQVFSRLTAIGAHKSKLEIKIFGGGHMLLQDPVRQVRNDINIGRKNVETALKTIQELGLNVTATDVGGNWGRK